MSAVHGSLLRQVKYTDHARAALWTSGALLFTALALLLGFGIVMANWRLGALLFDILFGSVALLWWAALLRISLLQDTPANARLVPQLRRRLMLTLTVPFVVLLPVVAALATPAVGHFGYLLAALALVFPFVLLLQRYPLLAMVPSVIIFASLSLPKPLLHAAAAFFVSQDEALVSLLMLLAIALLSEWALKQAFPRSGDVHAACYRKYQLRLEQRRGNVKNDFSSAVGQRWPGVMAAWRMLGLGLHSRRGSSPEQLTQYALGTSIFSRAASVPLTAVCGWLGAELVQLLVDQPQPASHIGSSLVELLALMSLPIGLQSLAVAISMRSTELGLLRLAPAMVGADRINATLRRVCLQAFGLAWLAVSLCVLVAERLDSGSWAVSGPMLLMLVMPLPFCGIVLRNYAAMPVPRTTANAGTLLMALAFVVAMALRAALPSVCGYIAIVAAAAGLWNFLVRWRAMLRAPVAFPPGRLA